MVKILSPKYFSLWKRAILLAGLQISAVPLSSCRKSGVLAFKTWQNQSYTPQSKVEFDRTYPHLTSGYPTNTGISSTPPHQTYHWPGWSTGGAQRQSGHQPQLNHATRNFFLNLAIIMWHHIFSSSVSWITRESVRGNKPKKSEKPLTQNGTNAKCMYQFGRTIYCIEEYVKFNTTMQDNPIPNKELKTQQAAGSIKMAHSTTQSTPPSH